VIDVFVDALDLAEMTADGVGCAKGELRCRELDRETEVQTDFLAPFWGFFSVGHFAADERKFGRHVK